MNQYGKHAQDTWRMIAPAEYAKIVDPEAFFTQLGEQAQQAVGELTYQIAGPDPKDETYLGKVGRINAAKTQAEEIVRAEMLTPEPEVQEEDEDGVDEDSPVAEGLQLRKELEKLRLELKDEEEAASLDRNQQEPFRR